MSRRKSILVAWAVAVALPLACSAPVAAPTVVPDDLATRVSATLAALPSEVPTVAQPGPAASDTPPPTATSEATTAAPSPTSTETPSLTGTPTPSATSVSGDPRTQLGQPSWRDTFAGASNWTLGEDSYTRAKVEDNQLRLTGLTTTDGWRLTWPEIDDFYLEATINSGSCEGNDHAGLIFRVPDRHDADHGYLLGFTCDGRYWLRLWDGEKMTTLVPLTSAAAILSGADKDNRMGVLAEGEKLALYANGQLLEEIEDDALTGEGGFGVFVGARKSGTLTIAVKEIAYWGP